MIQSMQTYRLGHGWVNDDEGAIWARMHRGRNAKIPEIRTELLEGDNVTALCPQDDGKAVSGLGHPGSVAERGESNV